MQLGQVFGLFLLPGGRPRLLLVFDTSIGSDLGIAVSVTIGSEGSSIGTDAVVGTPDGLSVDIGTEVSGKSLPSTTVGIIGRSSRGEVASNVIGSSCSLSKTCGENSDVGSLPNNSWSSKYGRSSVAVPTKKIEISG